MSVESPYLTAREAMAYLRRSRAYLTEHADEIGCYREGGQLFFRLADLQAWRERSYRPPLVESARATAPRQAPPRWLDPTQINPVTGRPFGSPRPAGQGTVARSSVARPATRRGGSANGKKKPA